MADRIDLLQLIGILFRLSSSRVTITTCLLEAFLSL